MIAKSCLIHHPDTDDDGIKAFYIGVKAHYQNGDLTLRYEVQGAIDLLAIPTSKVPIETDYLWQHTCFEAFIAVEEDEAYHEYNFSPSGDWAAYAFNDYRKQKSWRAQDASAIHCAISEDQLVLTAVIAHRNLPENPLNKSYRLGLSTVLKTKADDLSYWSLFHPSGAPDFHHRSSFTLSFSQS